MLPEMGVLFGSGRRHANENKTEVNEPERAGTYSEMFVRVRDKNGGRK